LQLFGNDLTCDDAQLLKSDDELRIFKLTNALDIRSTSQECLSLNLGELTNASRTVHAHLKALCTISPESVSELNVSRTSDVSVEARWVK
jgi:hypothetical protein